MMLLLKLRETSLLPWEEGRGQTKYCYRCHLNFQDKGESRKKELGGDNTSAIGYLETDTLLLLKGYTYRN